jgi:hypothetical protein
MSENAVQAISKMPLDLSDRKNSMKVRVNFLDTVAIYSRERL